MTEVTEGGGRGTLEQAMAYIAAGFSIIPIKRDGSKRPAIEWKEYQSRVADERELTTWFANDGLGIAVVGGDISRRTEIIDVDAPDVVDRFTAALREAVPKLADAPHVRTPSGGLHVLYRCTAQVPGNTKLAQRLVSDPSRRTGNRKDVVIETRGEGGYVIAPGSPEDCHPAKQPYTLISGSYDAIPVLTDDELVTVHRVARSFDQLPSAPGDSTRTAATNGAAVGGRPGDEYGASVPWEEILTPHGWTRAFTDRGGVSHWRRPGKHDPGTSATTNYSGSDLLYVFSSNADPFEDGHSYTKFAAYALLEHGGNFGEAASALAARGFGADVRATDFAVRADANPSYEMMELLFENSPEARHTWNHEGQKPASDTPIGWMMRLAGFMHRASWTKQQIADGLVAFRAKHHMTMVTDPQIVGAINRVCNNIDDPVIGDATLTKTLREINADENASPSTREDAKHSAAVDYWRRQCGLRVSAIESAKIDDTRNVLMITFDAGEFGPIRVQCAARDFAGPAAFVSRFGARFAGTTLAVGQLSGFKAEFFIRLLDATNAGARAVVEEDDAGDRPSYLRLLRAHLEMNGAYGPVDRATRIDDIMVTPWTDVSEGRVRVGPLYIPADDGPRWGIRIGALTTWCRMQRIPLTHADLLRMAKAAGFVRTQKRIEWQGGDGREWYYRGELPPNVGRDTDTTED
jgi:hypothetical protein